MIPAEKNGRNQMSMMGRIVVAAFLNPQDDERRRKRKDSECYIGGAITDAIGSVEQGFVALRYNDSIPLPSHSSGSVSNNFAFVHLNKTGNATDSHAKYRQRFRFFGVTINFATSDLTSAGQLNNKPDFVVMRGGSITMRNTGPYEIRQGDRLLWEVPHSYREGAPLTGPNLLPGTEYGKIYVWIVPYNPKTADILCSRSLKMHCVEHVKRKTERAVMRTGSGAAPITDIEKNAVAFTSNLMKIVMMCAPVLAKLFDAAEQYENTQDKRNDKKHLNTLSSGIKELRGSCDKRKGLHTAMGRVERMLFNDHRAMNMIMNYLYPDGNDSFLIAPSDPGTHGYDNNSVDADLVRIQTSMMTKLLYAAKETEREPLSREFGTSLGNALPLHDVDVLVNV